MSTWKGRDVLNILDFSRGDLEELFELAKKYKEDLKNHRVNRILEGYVIALAFFEPSTRTRMSFETAAKRLGAATVGFTSGEGTSIEKGETLADTIRMLDSYADLIVIRSKFEGSAILASEVAVHPVINGGDGKQHHPTQAMLDLFTVTELFGSPDGLTYAVVGDLRYGRAASSFLLGLTRFNPEKVILVSPKQLRARPEVLMTLMDSGIRYHESDLETALEEADVVYVTRIQKERFPDPAEYEKVKGSYRITRGLLEAKAKNGLKILHPLPRVDEISHDVDNTEWQAYFIQAANGIPVRMALLSLVLKGDEL
ncbi:MAG: aspartate carbamoyltransferase [Desulfurococcales archaeon]|nr:aspartate carbamoyltransferase [Desulfurococcales archaeon]